MFIDWELVGGTRMVNSVEEEARGNDMSGDSDVKWERSDYSWIFLA